MHDFTSTNEMMGKKLKEVDPELAAAIRHKSYPRKKVEWYKDQRGQKPF